MTKNLNLLGGSSSVLVFVSPNSIAAIVTRKYSSYGVNEINEINEINETNETNEKNEIK